MVVDGRRPWHRIQSFVVAAIPQPTICKFENDLFVVRVSLNQEDGANCDGLEPFDYRSCERFESLGALGLKLKVEDRSR